MFLQIFADEPYENRKREDLNGSEIWLRIRILALMSYRVEELVTGSNLVSKETDSVMLYQMI